MQPLRIKANNEEELLFRLLGIPPLSGEEDCALIIGLDEAAPDEAVNYVRLPDTEQPLAETLRMAEKLGHAVGQGRIHI